MDLQTRKIEFIQEFLKLQSEQAISRLEKILRKERKSSEKGTAEDFMPMSIEEFNKRIDTSLEDSKNDRIIEADELKAKMEKWG